jgi:DNA-binding NtrC family response regulator
MRKAVSAIVVATRDEGVQQSLSLALGSRFDIVIATTHARLAALLAAARNDVAIVDLTLLDPAEGIAGESALAAAFHSLQQISPATRMVCLYPRSHALLAGQILRASAAAPLEYPASEGELMRVVDGLTRDTGAPLNDTRALGSAWPGEESGNFETRTPCMQEVLERVRLVAARPTTVLLTGETGTGKGMIARLLHAWSSRSHGHFVAVHCSAVPETLIETELFGHEKGAFTGAVSRKLGKFELASGGTIFLDEIGTITPAVQVKLLQVLQDRSFERVGGVKSIVTDARVVAASNLDLAAMCQQGEFRSDLYFRLAIFPIHIPPLRQRLEDIPLLVEFFLRRSTPPGGEPPPRVSLDVLRAMMSYTWPGNLRELANVLERARILARTDVLTLECFPPEVVGQGSTRSDQGRVGPPMTLAEARHRAVEEAEERYLRTVLSTHQGRIGRSAAAAGVSPRQLHNLMKKHNLEKGDFKDRSRSQ